ncbi:MAG TPA: FkbM family methyltransferase, partial [Thermoanaerobaculia bacterium]|nr:FkbM family methyltransferase [Thermoanaerobaculia bacterium]
MSAEQTSAIYREIFEQEVYLQHGIALPEDACIFDVGANIGLFTLFARDRWPRARVFAFEPIRPTFEALRANVALYGDGARVFPFGLSDREEEADLTFYPRMAGLSGRFAADDAAVTRGIVETWLEGEHGPGAHGLSDSELAGLVDELLRSESHRCRLRPLSALLRELDVERIDLLKVDVEKSELRVLQGVDDEDWPKIGQVVLEVHTRDLLDAVSELLGRRGFELRVDELVPTGEAGELVWMVYAVRRDAKRAPLPTAPPLVVSEVRTHVQRALPAFLWPAAYVVTGALPLTPNGKVDRAALPAVEENRRGIGGYVAPRTEIERTLAEIWRELLKVDRVGIRDNFFELGGNSLLLVDAHGRLRRALGRDVPMRTLIRGQTIEVLADHLEEAWRQAPDPPLPPLRPVARDGGAPLSFEQERLWFLHRLAPGSSMLNVATAFRLIGALDAPALAAGLAGVCRRHEVLRTRIRDADGVPLQEVHPPASPALAVVDVARLPAPEVELRRRTEEAAGRPFDLAGEPPLRALLVRLGEREHVLVLTLHHLAVDAWSQEILFRELAEHYRARREARPPSLPPLPLQFADYAHWQRRALAGSAIEPQLAFWRRRLADPPPAPSLPGRRERGVSPRFRGAVHRFELDSEVLERIRDLSRSQGATPFMTLLAAFTALLHQYSGQADLVVGTNVANRNWPEIEGLIGYFANSLALRTDFSGSPTFRGLLARTRETVLEAFSHQEAPFEAVVADLQAARRGGRPSLFQVMFVMQSVLPYVWQLPGLETRPFDLGHQTASFDLMVLVAEASDRLLGAFVFDTDLFDSAAVERMAAQFQSL